MMRAVICKGDPTSHGGKVLEGNANVTTNGRQVAQRGHMTFCPKCKGNFPLAEGLDFHTYAGIGTAVDGMRTACGAKLMATQHTMQIDDGVNPFMDMLLRCTPAHRDELLAAVNEVLNAGNEEVEVSGGNGTTLTINVESFQDMLENMVPIDDGHARDTLDLLRSSSTVSEDEEFLFFGGGYNELAEADFWRGFL